MFKIAVLPGDGVGPEVVGASLLVLEAVAKRFGHQFETEQAPVGGQALDLVGDPLPSETLALAREADAVLLGAVGGPKWEGADYEKRPEKALLDLREKLGLYANLRPARIFSALADASPLRREVVEGVDLLVVRELTGGIYFGQPRGIEESSQGVRGINTEIYYDFEVDRIARKAFEIAPTRRNKVTSVDKANVLESSLLWRKVVSEVSRDYPDVELNHMLVDNCAMQLIRQPRQFDVILTTNIFGDILSDEAAMLTGSIGMLPSASLGGKNGMYEPVHGSAPDIAGKDLANPIGTIMSLAMMLRYSFKLEPAAQAVEQAVQEVLKKGCRTQDIYVQGCHLVGTRAMSDLIATEVGRCF